MFRSSSIQRVFAMARFVVSRHFVITIILTISMGISSGCRKKVPDSKATDSGNTSTGSAQVENDDANWAVKVERQGCPNLHKVSDGLYRGAQPEEKGFAELEKLGIKTVVCLRRWHDDEEEIEGTNLEYVAIPMNTWEPTRENVLKFLKVVTDEEKQPVFVHCLHGADRTGTMTAIYRIVIEGWTKEEALKEMQQGDFGYHEIWKMLPEFVEELDVEGIKKELDESEAS